MSRDAALLFRKYPLLLRYSKSGLVNLMAVARLLKSENETAEALGMELRRYIAKSKIPEVTPVELSGYPLQIVSRSNIREVILQKTPENQTRCLEVINKIAHTKPFVSLMTGEKEIVIMTDLPATELLKIKELNTLKLHQTDNLGFLSIDLPLEMRDVSGIYSLITSALFTEEITIHAFHTIGGEIIILFEQEDLLKAQEILQSLLS